MMKYLVHLTDSSNQHIVLITLPDEEAKKPAVEVIFDIVGSDHPEDLVKANVVTDAQLQDLKSLKQLVFDQDAQGLFIRDGISFSANGKDLNPELPFEKAFLLGEIDGTKYLRCDLQVTAGGVLPNNAQAVKAPPTQDSQEEQMQVFARVMFLHQVAIGTAIDVTKSHPEIDDIIAWAEHEELIEIDVQKASYRLTAKGKAQHEQYIQEAQELIKKFDIYGDVDMDSSGAVRFDTGLGSDLRVPVFEVNGVDPFRARFLLGINDGEWDQLVNWEELVQDVSWYQRMFEPIERAPAVDDIGRENLSRIQDEAKTLLRREIH
jgi:hypothetical protein